MKVLIATAMYPTPENPAFGSFVRTQAESLKKAGVDVDVLVLEGWRRKLIYPRGIFQLRQRLASSSPDLVHAHYSYVGMIARTQWNLPVVVTYHGSDLLGEINEQGKKTWFSSSAVAAGQILSHFADAVIVQNKHMASKLKRKDVYIIPQEIDFEVFHPVPREEAQAALHLDPSKTYVLFAANPGIPVKRYPLAKAVAESLRQEDSTIELLVVYREPQTRLALFMSACDALIFTSYQEGSPNIVKQAMACNLPIVATDVGDVRELISDTEGCYVSKPTVSEFVDRVGQVLCRRRRTCGREHVRALANGVVAQKLVRVYEETLEGRTWRTNVGAAKT